MKVSVVCENSVVVPMPRGLTGEHGLSLLIEDNDLTLYDTGQGFSLIKNLQLMGKNAEDIARIIISHGHYDHTGGLMPLLQERKNELSVYAHRESFMDKIALIELPDNNIEIPGCIKVLSSMMHVIINITDQLHKGFSPDSIIHQTLKNNNCEQNPCSHQ